MTAQTDHFNAQAAKLAADNRKAEVAQAIASLKPKKTKPGDVIKFLTAARAIDERNARTQDMLDASFASDREWRRQYRRVQDELRAAAKAAGFSTVRHALQTTQRLIRSIEHSMA